MSTCITIFVQSAFHLRLQEILKEIGWQRTSFCLTERGHNFRMLSLEPKGDLSNAVQGCLESETTQRSKQIFSYSLICIHLFIFLSVPCAFQISQRLWKVRSRTSHQNCLVWGSNIGGNAIRCSTSTEVIQHLPMLWLAMGSKLLQGCQRWAMTTIQRHPNWTKLK